MLPYGAKGFMVRLSILSHGAKVYMIRLSILSYGAKRFMVRLSILFYRAKALFMVGLVFDLMEPRGGLVFFICWFTNCHQN